jgi:2-C-methyl-D-erythritol 4-phosphate cytidylyltransferase
VHYWLVMPAAGSGTRVGGPVPKQYLQVAGASVIERALQVFRADERCQGIVVALDAHDAHFGQLPLASDARIRRVRGGARRCDSVALGLDALPADERAWVLVHDAARPCIGRSDVDRLIAALENDPVGGLLAAPLADTLKRAGESGPGTVPSVIETAPRTGLWRAFTPQMFRIGLLRQALEAARASGREPTDEAQAVEWLGHAPRLVDGDPGNIKITTAADLVLAGAWLAREGQG